MSRYYFQKQPSRGVLRKRCSENMQQIYRRKFNKCSKMQQIYRHGSSPVNLLHIFRTLFPRKTSGWLLLYFVSKSLQEISVIIILIFCLNFHASKCPYHQYLYLLLIYYQNNLLSKKCMELMKSINTAFTNLVRRDLAREIKIC